MRLAVDATPLLGRPTGIGVFTGAVLARLARRPELDVTAYALTWRGRAQLDTAVPEGVATCHTPLPARPLRAAWLRCDRPRLDRVLRAPDAVHGTNFVVPPSRGARIVTVHDLTCVRFPELCTADVLQYPALLRHAIADGAWIHAVSAFVAQECVEVLGAPSERVVTVPNGLDPAPPDWAAPPTASERAAAGRLAGGPRYVLGLSTVEPRKDFVGLVAAFERIAAEDADVRLVIAGPDGWGAAALTEAIRRSPHRDRIRRLGWVSDEERATLLRGASVFAYPSRYEGFGLPPLEAMAAGVPVVTTDAGALAETTAGAATLVPVQDPDALAEAILTILGDDAVAADLVTRGRQQAATLSWDRTVDGLTTLYRDAASAR